MHAVFSGTIDASKVTAAVVAATSVVAGSSPAVATVVPEAMRSSKVSTNFGKLVLAEDLTCEGKHRSKRECTQRRTIIVGFTTHLSMSVSLSVACVVCVSSRPFVGLPSFLVCFRCLYCMGEWVPCVCVFVTVHLGGLLRERLRTLELMQLYLPDVVPKQRNRQVFVCESASIRRGTRNCGPLPPGEPPRIPSQSKTLLLLVLFMHISNRGGPLLVVLEHH